MARTMSRRNRNGNGQQSQAPAGPQVPFVAAAHKHTELAFDQAVTPGTNAVQLGPFDVPSYGYLRHILLEVTTSSSGDLSTDTIDPDYPWNIIDSIQLSDVNGAPIFGPVDGYAAFVTNLLGGYSAKPDPRAHPQYSGTYNDPVFYLRLPIEVSARDGFGALANQNAAANYKVYMTINAASNLSSGGAATPPDLRIRGWLEAWSLPEAQDVAGRPQAETPPMLGSSMFHSFIQDDIQAGANTIQLHRVGSLLRYLAFIARDSSGVRDDTVFPDPAVLKWDAREMKRESQGVILEHMASAIPEAVDRPTGVFAFLMNDAVKNSVGDDPPSLWYPTVQSTRLDLEGTAASAGGLQAITCDIAPVEVRPDERYVETSDTGFTPAVGAAPAR